MASTPLRLGLKIIGRNGGATSRVNLFEIRNAGISGKAMRNEPLIKPKPWPYKEKGYNQFHASIMDGTTKRFGENTKIILVEGLPCLGKTEVAKTLAEELEMKHFPMTTMDDYYINEYGYDTRKLDPLFPYDTLRSFDEMDFVKNPKDDRAPFMQFCMFYHKFFQYVDALAHLMNTGEGVVVERSVYSDMVFLETMFSMNYVNRNEKRGYYEWRDKLLPELMKPHLVVYLDATPATVEENLKRRGKGEEKTFNRAFLEKLDQNYKEQYLQSISEHAEVLVYDWNTPGDAEIIVEDIERIDFERFDEHDPKMGDWRLAEDWDWSEKRWTYTNTFQRGILKYKMLNHCLHDCPRLYLHGEDANITERVQESAPGGMYAPGYNPDQGDQILFKTRKYGFKLNSD